MTLSSLRKVLSVAAGLMAAPLICLPAAIQATGDTTVCVIGTCASPGTLGTTDSISSTTYSFVYTFANSDTFDVAGTYSASGATPSVSFSAVATYLGNSTNTSSHADTLSVDLLQDFTNLNGLDGNYSASARLSQTNVASGSQVTSQLFFGAQGIGLMGPFTGNGSQLYNSGPTALTGLGTTTLADFNYTFVIAAGSPAIPEPAEISLVGLGLFALMFPLRRKRS